MNNDFDLIPKVLNYSKYVRSYIAFSIPNVHRDIRIHLLDECYNLVRYLYEAVYNKGSIRIKYINELLVTLSMLDYLTDYLKNMNIERRHLKASIYKLTEIKNRLYGWKRYCENEKKS